MGLILVANDAADDFVSIRERCVRFLFSESSLFLALAIRNGSTGELMMMMCVLQVQNLRIAHLVRHFDQMSVRCRIRSTGTGTGKYFFRVTCTTVLLLVV